MPELILSGGTGKGNENKLHALFLKIVKNEPILYIPIATKPSRYDKCYEWITSAFKRDVTMITALTDIDLSKFNGIVIGGGNTFKLLKEIKENKWEDKLKNFKGVIYGGSAGAIIFGKDISTCSFGELKDKNEVKLKDLRGLDLLDNFNLYCHFNVKRKEEVIAHIEETKVPIIALPNDSGIHVKDKFIFPINRIYIYK